MDKNRITLTGPRVTLRLPQAGDGEKRFALGAHPEIHEAFGGDPAQFRPLTMEAAEAWEATQLKEPWSWIIEVEDRLIGAIRLHSMNHFDARAVLGVGILDHASLGRGYGTEAMILLARHAFGPMGLHRLSLRVLAGNTRAVAAYAKVGFVAEGRLRESARIGDSWQDEVFMGMLPGDLADLRT